MNNRQRILLSTSLATLFLLGGLFVSVMAFTPTPAVLAQTCAQIVRNANGVPNYLRNCGQAPVAGDDVAAAHMLLRTNAAWLHLRPDLSDLTLVAAQTSLTASHLRFQQFHAGLPVWLAQVTVHIGQAGDVQMIQNDYAPDLSLNTQPAISAAQALDRARAALPPLHSLRGEPTSELLILPAAAETGAALAWRIVIPALHPVGDWNVFVEAQTGAVLDKYNGIIFDSGAVYDPNAVQTTGNPNLTDNNNANSSDLQAARTEVTLQGIAAGQNKLVGAFVNLCASGITGAYKPACQADEPSRVYNYTRDNDRFEETTVYAALDALQRYIQSLGFDSVNNRSIPVHAHYYSQDNSFFSTTDNGLHFGDGGVDDAEDADIIVHEYGHAVQHNQVPGWGPGQNTEQRAMGEGFGDYLAASFYAERGDPAYLANHAPCIGEWDAVSYAPLVNGTRCLRRVDGKDESSGVDIGRYSGTPSEEHDDGRYWSAALWCVRQALGRQDADRLILQSQFYLAPTTSNQAFEQGVDAMILADGQLYQGTHATAIYGCAVERGLIPVLPMAAPALIYPAGGETLLAGSIAAITWITNGAPISATYSLELTNDCTPIVHFQDDMEIGSARWITSQVGAPGWTLQTNIAHSPTHAWFAASTSTVSDQYLAMSQPFTMPSHTLLTFWHSYDLERRYDGGVIELSHNNGSSWLDLGPYILQNGYNETISSSYGSPISGRQAFSGNSNGFIETRVDLTVFGGMWVQLRFRNASDRSVMRIGWYVDDVRLTSRTQWQALGASTPGATMFPWNVPLTPGNDYCVRLRGQAPGYEESAWATGAPFTITSPIYLPLSFR